MRKSRLFSALALVFVLSSFFLGCSPRREGGRGVEVGPVVFSFQDSLFDDRGAGTYTYPVPLQDRDGIFDMKSFRVRDLGQTLEFIIDFLRPLDREGLEGESFQKGWAFQLLDIYIDTDGLRNSGRTFALPGRNIRFHPDQGWEKVIVLSPGPSSVIRDYLIRYSESQGLYRARNDVLAPSNVFVYPFRLVARVPKAGIGSPQGHWGFQVCLMGFDPENLALNGLLNREVNLHADHLSFGGGSEFEGNPNILDVLSHDRKFQYRVLSSFRSGPFREDNLLAILPMIYAKGKQNYGNNRKNSMNKPRDGVRSSVESRYIKRIKE